MDVAGAEGAGRGDLGKADHGVHQGQLPGVVEFEAGNAFTRRGMGRLGELVKLPAIYEGLKDILADVEVVVVDRRELAAQRRQVLDGLVHPVVGHIVGRRLGAQD